MAKAYWVATYRSIKNPDALATYAKLGGPALQAAGGRILARGNPARAYERSVLERVVLIEFDSVAAATTACDSPAYRDARELLGDASSATSGSSKGSLSAPEAFSSASSLSVALARCSNPRAPIPTTAFP